MDIKFKPLALHKLGLQQTASGYGSKLVTPYLASVAGRFRRVYAICYSNVASYYVIVNYQRKMIDFSITDIAC